MKKITVFFILLVINTIWSCSKEIAVPLADCTIDFQHDSENHPKAADFQALLDKYVALGLPGVSAVIYTPDDGKWIGAAGFAKLETQEPMKPCHVFHSASVAKTYHCAATMALAEQGKLDLDKTIDTYLPNWVCDNFPNANTATVRQLMNHTSGVPDIYDIADHLLDYYQDLSRTFTTEQYIDYVCGKKPDFEAGSRTSYSNTNTILLAIIMDEVMGNHANAITTEIVEKLNLQHTFYKNETGYPAPMGAVNTYIDTKGNGQLINSTELERNFANMSVGHDGMLASANDYFRFIHGLFNGELVSQNSLDEMLDFQPYGNNPIGEGLGLEVTKDEARNLTRAGHSGGSLGAANSVFHYVEQNTTIVICSNFGGFLPSPLSDIFYNGIKIGDSKRMIGEFELLLFGE